MADKGYPMSGRLELHQRLVMPPIANSLEEAVEQSKPHQAQFSERTLHAIKSYLESEDNTNPYSDTQVAERFHDLGYLSITTSDVASARKTLGIKPTSERYVSN